MFNQQLLYDFDDIFFEDEKDNKLLIENAALFYLYFPYCTLI